MKISYCEALLLQCKQYVPEDLKKQIEYLLLLTEDTDDLKEKYKLCFDEMNKDEFDKKFSEIIFNHKEFKSSYFYHSFVDYEHKKPEINDIIVESFGYEVLNFVSNEITVDFDIENFYITNQDNSYEWDKHLGFFQFENGLSCYRFLAGGDWQLPVFGIIYIYKNELYCYIPDEGNVYCKETNCAFDGYNEDGAEISKEFNFELMYSNILRKSCKNEK